MDILKSIWGIIISVFGFLIVWIFLPVFSIIGIYYQWKGKVPPTRGRKAGEIDARFLDKLEFKLDEDEKEWAKSIANRLRTHGYGQY